MGYPYAQVSMATDSDRGLTLYIEEGDVLINVSKPAPWGMFTFPGENASAVLLMT